MKPFLVVLLLLAACESVTAPFVDPAALSLSFAVLGSTGPSAPHVAPIDVEGEVGGLTVDGLFSTPSGGYTLTADLRRTDREYVLSIAGDQTGIGPDILVYYQYRATIRGLPAGKCRFIVEFTRPGRRLEVFAGAVRVR